MFVVVTSILMASAVSIGTEVNPEPGLLTETILKPRVLGSTLPANDWACVEVPPLAATFVKVYETMVLLLTVLTRSTFIFNATGQLLVTSRVMVPLDKVALVKFPKLPPL